MWMVAVVTGPRKTKGRGRSGRPLVLLMGLNGVITRLMFLYADPRNKLESDDACFPRLRPPTCLRS